MGETDKGALLLGGQTVLSHSVRVFADAIDVVVIVVAEDRVQHWHMVAETENWPKIAAITPGGTTRNASVRAGLNVLRADADIGIIAIHDGARPLITHEMITATIDAARDYGAVTLAIPVTDTIKRVENDVIIATLDRSVLWAAQTPQTFNAALLRAAFLWCDEQSSGEFTDEASMVEAYGHPVHIVRGSRRNLKITEPDDLMIAEALQNA